MKFSDMLSPKKIIFDAINDKLNDTSIVKIMMIFNVKEDKYNVLLAKEDNSSLKLNLEEKEINLIKKVLLTKIQRKIDQEFNRDVKAIIIELNFKEDDFKIFVQDIFDNVTKFDY